MLHLWGLIQYLYGGIFNVDLIKKRIKVRWAGTRVLLQTPSRIKTTFTYFNECDLKGSSFMNQKMIDSVKDFFLFISFYYHHYHILDSSKPSKNLPTKCLPPAMTSSTPTSRKGTALVDPKVSPLSRLTSLGKMLTRTSQYLRIPRKQLLWDDRRQCRQVHQRGWIICGVVVNAPQAGQERRSRCMLSSRQGICWSKNVLGCRPRQVWNSKSKRVSLGHGYYVQSDPWLDVRFLCCNDHHHSDFDLVVRDEWIKHSREILPQKDSPHIHYHACILFCYPMAVGKDW